jgi:hypothetical protein
MGDHLKVTVIFLAACWVAIPSWAAAQGGSTGGSLGKSGQELSGGPPKQALSGKPRASESSGGSVAGRWQWNANCGIGGSYCGQFQLTQTAGSQLSGSFLSDSGTFQGGRINGVARGKDVSFAREGSGRVLRYIAVLDSIGKPQRMEGSISEFGITGCSFTAVRG